MCGSFVYNMITRIDNALCRGTNKKKMKELVTSHHYGRTIMETNWACK